MSKKDARRARAARGEPTPTIDDVPQWVRDAFVEYMGRVLSLAAMARHAVDQIGSMHPDEAVEAFHDTGLLPEDCPDHLVSAGVHVAQMMSGTTLDAASSPSE